MNKLIPLIALFAAGCGGGQAPLANDEQAKNAVEACLNAWKEGKPPGTIATTPTAIEAIDSQWASKQELADYTLGPVQNGEGNRTFPAKLTLKSPSAQVETRYVVIGGGPIFVYRDEDYQHMINMENGPPPSPGVH
jgi:hypothetical protein